MAAVQDFKRRHESSTRAPSTVDAQQDHMTWDQR